ncbi:MAG TPA: hypothetical protein VL574_10540 [Stellaceae bacterium]|nr:hypothetical protein [Stellaceae bacterium]
MGSRDGDRLAGLTLAGHALHVATLRKLYERGVIDRDTLKEITDAALLGVESHLPQGPNDRTLTEVARKMLEDVQRMLLLAEKPARRK